MARKLIVITAVIGAIAAFTQYMLPGSVGVSANAAQKTAQPSQRQDFMREKLAMVGKIVEGLATEDFDQVREGGQELAALAESAAWLSNRDPFYRHYSSNFEQSVSGLLRAAESKSPEKVTFAYVHVTFSCTACHQHVRNVDRISQ